MPFKPKAFSRPPGAGDAVHSSLDHPSALARKAGLVSMPGPAHNGPRSGEDDAMAEQGCVLVADDHPLMRSALAQAVCRTLPRTEILEAGTLDQAIGAMRARPPGSAIDLILLDLGMPGINGFSGRFLIRAEFPAIPVIVVE